MHKPGTKRAAVFCMIFNSDAILLLKRKFPPHQGYYVPVGGKIDGWETPAQAIVREVLEETGYVISEPDFCGILVETSPVDYNWISFIYKVEVPDRFLQPCDEGDLAWIQINDIPKYPIPETDSYIYDYCFANTPFIFDAIFDHALTLKSLSCKLSQKQLIG